MDGSYSASDVLTLFTSIKKCYLSQLLEAHERGLRFSYKRSDWVNKVNKEAEKVVGNQSFKLQL